MIRTPVGVAALLCDKVAAAGVSSVSQYVADLLAVHVGLPALVRELNRMPNRVPGRAAPTLRGHRIMVRPDREVSRRLAKLAAEAGYPTVSRYIADIITEDVGRAREGEMANGAKGLQEIHAADNHSRGAPPSSEGAEPLTGRALARAEIRRIAARSAQRRADEAARELARRESTVRAVRHEDAKPVSAGPAAAADQDASPSHAVTDATTCGDPRQESSQQPR